MSVTADILGAVPALAPDAPATDARSLPRAAPDQWEAPGLVLSCDAFALGAALSLSGATASVLAVAYALGALLTLAACQGYRVSISLSALESAPWLLGRLAVPLVLLGPIVLLQGVDPNVFAMVLLAMAFVLAGRVASYALLRRLRHQGYLLEPAVILGAGQVGAELARVFETRREYGIVPVGFLDCVGGDLPLPLLGDVDRLDELLRDGAVRHVVVAFGPAREAELVQVLRTAVRYDVELHVVPRFFDVGVAPPGPDSDYVRGIPLNRVRRSVLRPEAELVKRAVDVVVAGTLLAVAAPLLAVVALLVRLTSPGPVLFCQDRVGRDGRVFKMRKFRTMVQGAEADLERLVQLNERDGVVFKIRNDPRCTPVGRWLRRFSIDELPQLWHVLTGDMSLVGPRPAVPGETARYDQDARWRLMVKPGLTGLWQVSGRSDLPWAESLRLDLYYIYNWSVGLDLMVMGRTLGAVLRREGAY
jgi:exopolysaccharide biosynthesis polyprenyl glycosylphosphotransferase